MQVHVLTESAQGPQLPTSIVPTATYGELHLGSSEVPIYLWNMSVHPIEVSSKALIDKVTPANQVLLVVLLMETLGQSACGPQKGWILKALNLQDLKELPQAEQEQARGLLLKWEYQFPNSDLDLGKTSLIKHWIELMDPTSFKEHYWHIPPHMYNDVKAHLQKMLHISVIRKSHSLWASVVVLVWRKDGSLRFCIDLRKLNNQTIKDAYLLPHIDDTLNSLQGSQWFSSLNLMSGHSQDKLDEESKLLTAFSIGPLGFYKCNGTYSDRNALQINQCPFNLSVLDGDLPWGS